MLDKIIFRSLFLNSFYVLRIQKLVCNYNIHSICAKGRHFYFNKLIKNMEQSIKWNGDWNKYVATSEKDKEKETRNINGTKVGIKYVKKK